MSTAEDGTIDLRMNTALDKDYASVCKKSVCMAKMIQQELSSHHVVVVVASKESTPVRLH
jgi:hypothetical protein